MKKGKLLLLLIVTFIYSGMYSIVQAQSPNPPESLPETPVHEASDVLSIYSEVYTPAATFTFHGTDAKVDSVVLNEKMLAVKIGSGTESCYIQFASPLDLSGYNTLFLDVYAVEQNSFNFRIRPENNPDHQLTFNVNTGWNRLEVDLTDFLILDSQPDLSAISQINFVGEVLRNVYIDNIYACKAVHSDLANAPATPAPAPTQKPADVLSVFTDAYEDEIGVTINSATVGNPKKIKGIRFSSESDLDKMIYVKGGKTGNGGLDLNTAIDVSEYDSLHFDVYPVGNTIPMRIVIGGFATKSSPTVASAATPNAWNSIDVSLADLAASALANNPASVVDYTNLQSRAFWFFQASGYERTFFLDNVYFYKANGANPLENFLSSPPHDSEEVLALFSNTYTSATSIKNFEGTGSKKEIVTVSGKNLIYIESGLNDWENINFNEAQDISAYDSLSLDIYVVSGTFDLKIQLEAGSSSVIATPKLQEGWNRVKIKLNDFISSQTPPNLASISRIGVVDNEGSQRTIYMDNIYAFSSSGEQPVDPDLPAQMAPVPAHDATKVKSVFSDAYTSVTNITNFTGTGTGKILTVSSDQEIMKIENGLNHWANINFQSINIDDRDSLHVDIFVVRESGNVTLKFAFDDDVSEAVVRVLTPGWNYLDISLADFKKAGKSLVAVTQFRIIRDGGYPQTIFIDNLYTYGDSDTPVNPEDPTAPTVSAPTPMHEQEVVMSFFSNAYANIATLSQSNPGQPTSQMDFVTPIIGDDMIRFSELNWTLIKVDPATNIADMDYLHLDVFSLGEPKIIIGLGDGGANEGRSAQLFLLPGWNSIDLSIDNVFKANGGDMANVKMIRIYSATGFAISKLYFDNIYAYQGEPGGDVITYEIKPAPEPIMPPKTVKSIYSDKYTNLTELEKNTSGANTKLSFPKIEKDESVIKLFSLDNVSLLVKTTLNVSEMEFIHLNVYKAGSDANVDLEIGFKAKDATNIYYSTTKPVLKNDDWSYINIPVQEVKDAGVDCSLIENIVFRGSGNVYVDNVFAFRGEYVLGLGEEGKITVDWAEAGKADVLPDRNQPFLGVNLASACGGQVPGTLGQNYTYPSVQDLQYFKSKGVRLFRFPFKWERMQHDVNGALDLDLDVAKMKEVIAEAERLGMYVMPDMHNFCRRIIDETTYKFGESDALTKEHFGDVWKKLALELKSFTNIWGYDIMNEPYGLSPGVWQETAQIAINAIRSVDTETPIVVEGESYAAASTWPTTGGKLINLVDPSNKIIFQAHTYFDADKTGLYVQENYDKEVTSPTMHIDRLSPFVNWLNENNVKGILGEFGVPRNDARWLTMLDEVLAYLKKNGVSATYWVGGNGYANDKVSVQPLEDFTVERAQMRILEKYFSNFVTTNIDDVRISEKNQLITYPNPVIDQVFITTKREMQFVRIFNFSGSEIKSVRANGTHFEINMSDVTNGIYLLLVQFKDGGMATNKILKK
jgi:aryl-phospho-beta-D-glucosidase BglC (GH1 family)